MPKWWAAKFIAVLPAFVQGWNLATHSRIVRKLDEDQAGFHFVRLPQKVQASQPVGILM